MTRQPLKQLDGKTTCAVEDCNLAIATEDSHTARHDAFSETVLQGPTTSDSREAVLPGHNGRRRDAHILA